MQQSVRVQAPLLMAAAESVHASHEVQVRRSICACMNPHLGGGIAAMAEGGELQVL